MSFFSFQTYLIYVISSIVYNKKGETIYICFKQKISNMAVGIHSFVVFELRVA